MEARSSTVLHILRASMAVQLSVLISYLRPDHLEHTSSNAEDSSGYPSSPPPPTQTTQMTTANAEAPTQADLAQPTAPMASASAPEIQGMRFLNASSVPFSPSFDSGLLQSSTEAHNNTGVRERSCSSSPTETDVTPIMEALRSKDRIWLLKLADMMESLINERRCVFTLLLDPVLAC